MRIVRSFERFKTDEAFSALLQLVRIVFSLPPFFFYPPHFILSANP